MKRTIPITRRTLTKGVAGTGLVTLLAGCMERSPGEENGEEEGPIDDEEPAEDVDEEEWADVDEFRFEADARGWVGREPEFLDEHENPDLVLFAGETYDFTLVNGDGVEHNFELREGDPEEVDDTIGDYETEFIDEEDETWTLEDVEAEEEMSVYVCDVHPDSMYGEIEVRS